MVWKSSSVRAGTVNAGITVRHCNNYSTITVTMQGLLWFLVTHVCMSVL